MVFPDRLELAGEWVLDAFGANQDTFVQPESDYTRIEDILARQQRELRDRHEQILIEQERLRRLIEQQQQQQFASSANIQSAMSSTEIVQEPLEQNVEPRNTIQVGRPPQSAPPDDLPDVASRVVMPGDREWQDSTGSYSVKAQLAEIDGEHIVLLKPDDAVIRVARSKLSAEDNLFLHVVEDLAVANGWGELIIDSDETFQAEVLQRNSEILEADPDDDDFKFALGRPRKIHEVNRSLYVEYLDRRKERRVYALDMRRQLNSMKGPHVYRTAIAMPINPLGVSAIQAGWVIQPPIPYPGYRRGRVYVRGYTRSDGTYVRPHTRSYPD
jgi:hypothetical protein